MKHGKGEAEEQGAGEEENDATTRDRQGTGLPVKARRRAGGREVDVCMQRDAGTPKWENPGANRTWNKVKYGIGGKPDG